MTDESDAGRLLDCAAMIVSAYVANNRVPPSELLALIGSTYSALTAAGSVPAVPAQVPLTPAVPVRKSITPDYLISLEDGRSFKTLKRHLAGRGMTPEQYRAKWDLPADYPMVAPAYAERRSALAKSFGLGRKRSPAPVVIEKPRRGRRAKSAAPE